MDSRLTADTDTTGPSFGGAVVAVLAAGVFSSWISALLFGLAPALTHTVWLAATSVIGAFGLRFVLRLLGYEIALVAAFAAVAIGSVIGIASASAMPGVAGPGVPFMPAFGMFSGVIGLLVGAWIVQHTARPTSETGS